MKIRLFPLLALFPLLVLIACGKQSISLNTPSPQARPLSLAEQADKAWQNQNYRISQRLYDDLLKQKELPKKTRSLAWERLAQSAVNNRDWNAVLDALNGWAKEMPDATSLWPWNRIKAIHVEQQLGAPAAETFLTNLLQKDDLPKTTKDSITEHLLKGFGEHKDLAGILGIYALQYGQASSMEKRANLEREVLHILQEQPLAQLHEAATQTAEIPLTDFPKNILTGVYDLRRIEDNPQLWPEVWQDLMTLKDTSQWADTFPFANDFKNLMAKWGPPRRHIALLIPLQGPYASIGWRIAQGVGAGQWQLNNQGMDLQVTIINTSAPGWQKELAHLDAACQIIGGPLCKPTLTTLLQQGMDKERAFFSFMPSVEEEGTRIWRFFGSPRDQVRTMVRSAMNQGIFNFAVVYPQESYGQIMSRQFAQEVEEQGGTIAATMDYNPQKPSSWGKSVAELLQAENLDKDELNPEPAFKAVFMPDTLKNAKLLVPQFFFYNENRLLFLGSQLWEQGKNPDSPMEASYFDLAIYPGGWWNNNPEPQMKDLQSILQETGQQQPDFWTALGFDFIRFSAGLGTLETPLSPDAINERLAARQAMFWTIAPLTWDENGLASQEYFVFQPSRRGPRIADAERIATTLSRREAHRQERLEALNATLEANGTLQGMEQ